jgi:hypothetical protein
MRCTELTLIPLARLIHCLCIYAAAVSLPLPEYRRARGPWLPRSRPAPHVCMSMPDQRTPRRKNFFTAIMLLVVIGEGTLLVMAVLAVLGVI